MWREPRCSSNWSTASSAAVADLLTWIAVLRWMKPSFLSRSDKGFSLGKGVGGAEGRILKTNLGEVSAVIVEMMLVMRR